MIKKCKLCRTNFTKKPRYSYKQWQQRQFCSNKCSAIFKAPMFRSKAPWNKGTRGLMGNNVKGFKKDDPRITGENNYQWQGDYPSYAAVHMWLKKHYGKASICEFCGDRDKKMYHWSNVSGSYKRDILDWQQLCVTCHSMYDKGRLFA